MNGEAQTAIDKLKQMKQAIKEINYMKKMYQQKALKNIKKYHKQNKKKIGYKSKKNIKRTNTSKLHQPKETKQHDTSHTPQAKQWKDNKDRGTQKSRGQKRLPIEYRPAGCEPLKQFKAGQVYQFIGTFDHLFCSYYYSTPIMVINLNRVNKTKVKAQVHINYTQPLMALGQLTHQDKIMFQGKLKKYSNAHKRYVGYKIIYAKKAHLLNRKDIPRGKMPQNKADVINFIHKFKSPAIQYKQEELKDILQLFLITGQKDKKQPRNQLLVKLLVPIAFNTVKLLHFMLMNWTEQVAVQSAVCQDNLDTVKVLQQQYGILSNDYFKQNIKEIDFNNPSKVMVLIKLYLEMLSCLLPKVYSKNKLVINNFNQWLDKVSKGRIQIQ